MLKLLNDAPGDVLPSHSDGELKTPSTLLQGFLRREELAQQLGLSPRTIDRWQALRKGPPRVCVGRTILYNVESVRDWLRSREQELPSVKKRSRSRP
jgi:predicted DNA-binding transcriptional regulator AlpA